MPYVASLFAALLAGAAPASVPPAEFAAFDLHVRQVLADAGIPGGAYAIVRDGAIVHAAGHGVRALGDTAPVGSDTVFRIASVSKTFTAQLAALLVSEDKLHWDDGIDRYLPAFELKRPGQAQRLQLKHLLGQSTGLVPNAYDNLLEADEPLEKILPRFRELEPLCPPGQCYTYQNALFALIDPAITQATRTRYDILVRERLFRPLHMDTASIGLAAFDAVGDRALPHVRRGGRWRTSTVRPGYYGVAPAAGINASAVDLGKWLIAQMGHAPQVVPPALVEELTRERVRTPRELRRRGWRDLLTDAHYGLGWRIYAIGEEKLYLHSGWVEGYVADIAYSRRRGIGLAVLLNGETGAISEITTAFWKQVLATPSPWPSP